MAKYLIVGAGVGGLFSARALTKAGIPSSEIIILEKEQTVGGKCRSYHDPHHLGVTAEYGAALVPHNAGLVLDAINEKKQRLKPPLATRLSSTHFVQKFRAQNKQARLAFITRLLKEISHFLYHVHQYENKKRAQHPLPSLYHLSFSEFSAQQKYQLLNDLLRPLITGFGYGHLDSCPCFAIFEYLGYSTLAGLLPFLIGRPAFYTLQDGFQSLLKAMAEDYCVIRQASIQHIQRHKGIRIEYQHEGRSRTVEGEHLILALSPLQWPSLNFELTAIEQECLDNLSYYRYPVLLCKLKAYPAQHEFFETGLKPNTFGQLALITSHDRRVNPSEGRLCTAYVNLPPGPSVYTSAQQQYLFEELAQISEGVEIIEHHCWEDYFSFLPWDLRCQLASQQFSPETATAYVNSCLSFESVACIARQATELIATQLARPLTQVSLRERMQRIKILMNSRR
jgi:predicted NAD/FAD-binding protein